VANLFRIFGFLSGPRPTAAYAFSVSRDSAPFGPRFRGVRGDAPKLSGAKIILDIHDIVPEFYASKFKVTEESFIFKALVGVERASCSFADHVIIANHVCEERLTGRSVKKENCTTMLNYPDTTLFRHAMRTRADGKFVMLYPGTLNHHQGLDVAIRAFAMIADGALGTELHI
jgi:glycosyltransferase involved in cell wall biosynthesis